MLSVMHYFQGKQYMAQPLMESAVQEWSGCSL